jgi:CRISPR-associated protein Cmr4
MRGSLLRRAQRDGLFPAGTKVPIFPQDNTSDGKAVFDKTGPLALGDKVVLEEYTFTHTAHDPAQIDLQAIGSSFKEIVETDPVWQELSKRLVLVGDGQMSFFCTAACEVAQHVRINDATGAADKGGLFNQENVPSDTLFYSVLRATDSRLKDTKESASNHKDKNSNDALAAFKAKLNAVKVFQFGADASTGLGFCTVTLKS